MKKTAKQIIVYIGIILLFSAFSNEPPLLSEKSGYKEITQQLNKQISFPDFIGKRDTAFVSFSIHEDGKLSVLGILGSSDILNAFIRQAFEHCIINTGLENIGKVFNVTFDFKRL